MIRPTLRAASALLLVTALGGCISLLPTSKPAQLYRFGAPATGKVAADTPESGRVAVVLSHVDMQRAAGGDQILTVTGDQAAFIAAARWLSPASVLFEGAVQDAFAARSTQVRLLDRAEFAAARATLRLDVPAFETRYAAPGAAPTVHVVVRAMLTHRGGGAVAERDFAVDAPASANRVSAIVDAYGAAVDQVTSRLTAWTDANAALAAAPEPSPPPAFTPAARTTTQSSSVTVRRP